MVVRGGGHSYQGTSCAADSLLVWTREMNAISLHEAFVARGGQGRNSATGRDDRGRRTLAGGLRSGVRLAPAVTSKVAAVLLVLAWPD